VTGLDNGAVIRLSLRKLNTVTNMITFKRTTRQVCLGNHCLPESTPSQRWEHRYNSLEVFLAQESQGLGLIAGYTFKSGLADFGEQPRNAGASSKTLQLRAEMKQSNLDIRSRFVGNSYGICPGQGKRFFRPAGASAVGSGMATERIVDAADRQSIQCRCRE